MFTYRLVPTFDFTRELLSKGELIEVVSPLWLRKEIANELRNTLSMYDDVLEDVPYLNPDYVFDYQAHHDFAKHVADESIVLLKNENNALPLKKGTRVALFGKATIEYIKGGGGSGDVTVAVMDYGLQKDMVDSLTKRGAKVTVYPATTKATEVLADNPDGIMLSGGPGNPADYLTLIEEVKQLMASKKPLFGIGLGHQLAALSMGGKTEKLKFGHRGANQPVKDLKLDLTFATTQNCGYTVVAESLDKTVAQVSHVNVNDQTVEGIRYLQVPAVTVQYQPECKPGPKNMPYLLDEFIKAVGGKQNA